MQLIGKQKRFLRAKANHLRPVFSIGKNGLSSIWLEEVNNVLNNRELIKVNILQNADVTTSDVKNYIEQNSNIKVVQTIGRILVLFKESDDPEKQDISKDVTLI
ncbi:ribosome assembly RNA-binding protein YhbY [Lentilactobacillus laojiaonis]|uniref:ribosome assembly RNA-binding protein YhbY n=1 Tax=Lentilactobacillus laojiaonis TaxID=2883998 RepID=UPI001D099ED4|nr:ribosome assembly RNA-binding protein YhbY [Lentilactobacillus laojiaonis]UDM32593.1 ribosome assembly RNA-binding protein YhbY [Lentilactobacillus laojiaonis]